MDPQEMINQLQRMLRSRTVPVVITDREGHLIYLNEAAEALSGRTLDEVRGQRPSSYFVLEDQERVRRAGEEAAGAGGAVEVDYVRVAHADGTDHPIAMIVANLQGKGGDHLAKLAIAVDLTHQERLADRLRAARDELAFYSDLTAHDLRNYAQTMNGYLESVLNGTLGALTPEQRRALQVCKRQTQRVSLLIDQVALLLSGSQREAEGEPAQLSDQQLRLLMEQAAEAAINDFPDRAPRIAIQAPDDATVRVCANFATALQCLIRNAVDNNPQSDVRVWIRATPCPLRSRPGWCISIEDNGPGIPAEVRDWVLSDAHAPARPGSGTGLRLALAIIRSCGGLFELDGKSPDSSEASPANPHLAEGSRSPARPPAPRAAPSPQAPLNGPAPHAEVGTSIRLVIRAADGPDGRATVPEPGEPSTPEVVP